MTNLVSSGAKEILAAAGSEDEDKVKAEIETVANWINNEILQNLKDEATYAKENYDEFKRVYDLEVARAVEQKNISKEKLKNQTK